MRDKSRKVLQIAELNGIQQGVIQLNTLYRFVETDEKGERVNGRWEKEGELKFRQKLQTEGLEAEFERLSTGACSE
jgi:pilus assembly protein CpaF